MALAASLLVPHAGWAQSADDGSHKRLGKSIAVLGLDALGVDEERVRRLESLFRIELQRLAGKAMPSRKAIEDMFRGNRRLRACTGRTRCLAAIGRKLGVDFVVTGNVASLGDSYVVNIKAIDTGSSKELRRIASDRLHGDEDDLIEPVRVAAYRLLAPNELKGAIALLTDVDGANVDIDGKAYGQTPLPRPISGLPLGAHTIRVSAKGYSDVSKKVTVRFQKTSRVVVRLITPKIDPVVTAPVVPTKPKKRFYKKPWFYVVVGAGALLVGGAIGYSLGGPNIVDCTTDPMACQ